MQSEPHPNIFPSRPSINKHRVLRATHETIKDHRNAHCCLDRNYTLRKTGSAPRYRSKRPCVQYRMGSELIRDQISRETDRVMN